MKKIILLFLIIVSINYNLNAQIALTGNITTAGVAVYPTHIDSLGKGGLMTLPDLSTRNALPVKRRKQGMMVYVQANDSLYKLTTVDVSLNSGWVAMGILTQQKLTDSLNSRLKVTDTLSLSARIDLKANAGSITDVTTLIADKLNISYPREIKIAKQLGQICLDQKFWDSLPAEKVNSLSFFIMS